MTGGKQRVALVTGGGTGIGRAIAEALIADGVSTYILGRRADVLERAAAEIGAHAIVSDVTYTADLDQAYARIAEERGGLDIVVANAGATEPRLLADATEAYFDELVNLNYKGVFFTVQKALPLLRDGASVVITGSAAAHTISPGGGVYASTKAAIRTLARTWALELGPRGIRVNVVIPGAMAGTPLLEAARSTEAGRKRIESFMAKTPMGRMGHASEVAHAVMFLCSTASYTTGAEIPVDGGLTQV
jgi:NAD(P)-dependent dehydrogenase (short-subunit alcohol dehydrogenase family)